MLCKEKAEVWETTSVETIRDSSEKKTPSCRVCWAAGPLLLVTFFLWWLLLHYELVWCMFSLQILLWSFGLETACTKFRSWCYKGSGRAAISLSQFINFTSSPWLSLPRSQQVCQAQAQTSIIFSNSKLLAPLSQCAPVKNNLKEIWKRQSQCHKSWVSMPFSSLRVVCPLHHVLPTFPSAGHLVAKYTLWRAHPTPEVLCVHADSLG